MGSMCVSSCRCCVFVSVVQLVAILSAVFCVICSCCCCLPRPGPSSSQSRFPLSR